MYTSFYLILLMVGFVLRSIAKFSQRCSACGKPIYVGTCIERWGKRWRHTVCPLAKRTAYCLGSSARGGSLRDCPVSSEVCSETPGALWLMAQGTAPASVVSIGQLLGRGVTEEDRAEHVEVLELLERVRRASYDDTRIGSSTRPRWRRGVLACKRERYRV